jgi:hypothetical protein
MPLLLICTFPFVIVLDYVEDKRFIISVLHMSFEDETNVRFLCNFGLLVTNALSRWYLQQLLNASYVVLCTQSERDRREEHDRSLRQQGWEVRAVPRDGNCFLVALLLLAVGEGGTCDVHRVRRAICTAAAQYPARSVAGFVYADDAGTPQTFDECVACLAKDDEFFDEVGIRVRTSAAHVNECAFGL